MDKDEPTLPIAISMINTKYLLFDIQVLTWLKRTQHLCGAMIGTLPQAPSQNVFLGLPVEIMPEEAQLLVEKGVGYIVNDARAHDTAMRKGDAKGRAEYVQQSRDHAERISSARAEQRQLLAASKKKRNQEKRNMSQTESPAQDERTPIPEPAAADEDNMLFASTSTIKPNEPMGLAVTPTDSSTFLLTPPKTPPTEPIVNLPSSYPLYRHLNSRGYYMTPGLRFGCQYCVYPGDPLRFHSHFLAVGTRWDEEIDLMDIVGGGRLGTGVKKGYLIGGEDPDGNVRTFSIEWAAM